MKSVKYLIELQKKKDISDTAMAELLGITQPAISNYKAGRRVMDDETCLAVALQLDIDPMNVLGAAFLDRAEKTGQKSLWEVFMSRAAMTAGAVLVASGVNLFLTPTPANAASMRVSDSNIALSIDYALNRDWQGTLFKNDPCRDSQAGPRQPDRICLAFFATRQGGSACDTRISDMAIQPGWPTTPWACRWPTWRAGCGATSVPHGIGYRAAHAFRGGFQRFSG